MNIRISASILAADFCNLRAELAKVKGADLVHFDVMDGQFVPNISFGLPVIEAVSRCTELPLDVHLMIKHPENYLEQFAAVRPEIITVHYEAAVHLQRTLARIRELGCKAGVSLNPHTPLDGLRYVLDDLDLILVMTVNPGFGGQRFIPAMLEKIRDCRELIAARPIELQVDGVVRGENIRELAEAGANNFVAGSAIFQAEDPAAYIEALRRAVR